MPQFKLSELGLTKENVQAGDKLEFTVKQVGDDHIELSYVPDVESADENPQTMPLAKMRKKMVEKHGETDSQGY